MQHTEKPDDPALRQMICAKCGVGKEPDEFPLPASKGQNTMPNIDRRRRILQQLTAQETVATARDMYKLAIQQGYDAHVKTMTMDLQVLQIMMIPCYKLGHSIYGLPQGVFTCFDCEPAEVKPEPPKAESPIHGEKRYCVACRKDCLVQVFESKSYCQNCGVPIGLHTCVICDTDREPFEMIKKDCVYCLLERRSTKDILRVREHMIEHAVAAEKIREFVGRQFPKLIGVEM